MAMQCKRCGESNASFYINGECPACYQPRRCKECDKGIMQSKPTPNWQNRWVCDNPECVKGFVTR
jgi:hypothetical protein